MQSLSVMEGHPVMYEGLVLGSVLIGSLKITIPLLRKNLMGAHGGLSAAQSAGYAGRLPYQRIVQIAVNHLLGNADFHAGYTVGIRPVADRGKLYGNALLIHLDALGSPLRHIHGACRMGRIARLRQIVVIVADGLPAGQHMAFRVKQIPVGSNLCPFALYGVSPVIIRPGAVRIGHPAAGSRTGAVPRRVDVIVGCRGGHGKGQGHHHCQEQQRQTTKSSAGSAACDIHSVIHSVSLPLIFHCAGPVRGTPVRLQADAYSYSSA